MQSTLPQEDWVYTSLERQVKVNTAKDITRFLRFISGLASLAMSFERF